MKRGKLFVLKSFQSPLIEQELCSDDGGLSIVKRGTYNEHLKANLVAEREYEKIKFF